MALTTSKFLILFLSFSLHLLSLNCKQRESNEFEGQFPALYVFGDSLVDHGNNNHLPTKSKANFLPYGIDFEGGKPTGRVTNGRTVADYIALQLGLPLVPPYMGLSDLQRKNITTGINYASAGSGILPKTGNDGGSSCLSFDKQRELFQKTLEVDLQKQFDKQENLKKHLSESLFLVSMGVNDYDKIDSTNSTAYKAFGRSLLHQFSIGIKKLYDIGARKFMVNNIPPAGCIPTNIIQMKPNAVCNEEQNRMINFYNKKLLQALQLLQSQLPDSIFVHSNYFKFLLDLRANAKAYGITDVSKPCCSKKSNGTVHCQPNTIPCRRRDTHLFFDVHPSQVANYIFVKHCFSKLSICKSYAS